jgi:hypothetical protein
MEQSPYREANGRSPGQEIPQLRDQNGPALGPVLNLLKPVHMFIHHYFEIYFNIILQSMPRFSH